jgi:hypothetical protein
MTDSPDLPGPRVQVTPVVRWAYALVLIDGLVNCGCWWAYGSRKHADRKAARILARYKRKQAAQANSHYIESGDS